MSLFSSLVADRKNKQELGLEDRGRGNWPGVDQYIGYIARGNYKPK